MNYTALFFTHTGAIRFERTMKRLEIKGELQPSPRQLTSGCGIAAIFSYQGKLQDLINPDIEKVYILEEDGYRIVYEAENV